MKTKKVVSYDNLPTRLPIWPTGTAFLLLDRFHAVGWVWGIFGTLFALIWIVALYAVWTQESTPVVFAGSTDSK